VRSSIVSGVVGSKPVTVFFCKSTIMPMFTFSEDLGPLPHWEVSVPSHASVSVVSGRRLPTFCARFVHLLGLVGAVP
jgi:hypothetical protein